jgi:hypothetical protein
LEWDFEIQGGAGLNKIDVIAKDYSYIAPRDLYWLIPRTDEPTLGNDPALVIYGVGGNDDVIPFTEKLQRYFRSMNSSGNDPASIARDNHVFQDMQDIHNTQKVRDAANYITGERLDLPPPALELKFGFAGNVVAGEEIISPGTSYTGFQIGTPILHLESIDPDNLIPVHLLPVWKKHHVATLTNTTFDGRRVMNPPPQMGTRTVFPYYPSYAPVIGKDLYYPLSRLAKVPKGFKMPNPYWPAWEPWKWGVAP